MQEGLSKQGLNRRVDMQRGQDHLIEVLQRIGLKYKTSLDLINVFQIKSLPSSQKLVVIECLTLYSRGEKVLNHQSRSQFVESVVKSTMVVTLKGYIIALVVARVVTK